MAANTQGYPFLCDCSYQSIGCAPLVLLCDVGDVSEDHREGDSEDTRDRDQSEIPPAEERETHTHIKYDVFGSITLF